MAAEPERFGCSSAWCSRWRAGLLLMFLIPSVAGAQTDAEPGHETGCNYNPGTWHPLPPLPEGLSSPVSCSVNGTVWLMGGFRVAEEEMVISDRIYFYCPGSIDWNTVGTVCPEEHPMAGAEACGMDGRIYIIGGLRRGPAVPEYSSRVDYYDPVSDSWGRMKDLPEPLAWCGAAVYEDGICVTGGIGPDGRSSDRVYHYDPGSDRWKALKEMQMPRHRHAAEAVGDRVYVMGGVNNRVSIAGLKSMETLDPGGGEWDFRAPVPVQVCDMGSAVMEDEIYLAGGRVTLSEGGFLPRLLKYDPEEDQWEYLDELPGKIFQPALEAGERSLYLMGGRGPHSEGTRRAWHYDLNDVILKASVPDQLIDHDSGVIDLSAHFEHYLEEPLAYGICPPSNPAVILATVRGEMLIIKGLLPGETSMGVWAQSETDAVGDEFLVENRVTGRPDRSLCDYSQGTWHSLSPLPLEIDSYLAAMEGGRLYLFGESGPTGDGGDPVPRVWIYDPEADSWNMDGPVVLGQRSIAGASVLAAGGKIFLMGGTINDNGGESCSARVDCYDPAGDLWERRADLPVPLAWFGSSACGGRLYITGGCSNDGNSRSSVYRYDPRMDSWESLADMYSPRCRHASGLTGGKILAAGGINNGVSLAGLKSAEIFDPESGTWEEAAPFHTQVCDMASFVLDGGFCLAGGRVTSSAGVLSSIWKFSPEAENWIYVDKLPGKPIRPVAVAKGRQVYLLGVPAPGTDESPEFWKFEPDEVILKRPIPDQLIGEDSLVIDLSEYMVHETGEPVIYNVCYLSDPAILSAEVSGHLLVLKGTYPGKVTVGIMGIQGSSRITFDFEVENLWFASHSDDRLSTRFSVHTGPGGNHFIVECVHPGRYQVRVFGTDGRLCAVSGFTGASRTLDASGLSGGIYIVEVISEKGTRYTGKLFKP